MEDLLQKGVLDHLEAVSTISTNASKEFSLEKALDKMHADWEGLEFRIVEYKDTGTFIMGGTDEVQVRAGGVYFLLRRQQSRVCLGGRCGVLPNGGLIRSRHKLDEAVGLQGDAARC